MARSRRFLLGLALIGACSTVGGLFAQQPREVGCTINAKGNFSIGYVEQQAGKIFRCLATYDKDLRPSGASWVRVVKLYATD